MHNLDASLVRSCLDEAYERLKGEYVKSSVLGVVREYAYRSILDLECWVLFCAVVDFQVPVVNRLLPMLRGLLGDVEGRGLKFIDLIFDDSLARDVFANFRWCGGVGFSHRLLKVDYVLSLFKGLRDFIGDYKSIGSYVKQLYGDALRRGLSEPLEPCIKGLARALRGYVSKYLEDPEKLGLLIPDPDKGSALKRLCLFFRWMARPYPDLGVWDFVDKRHLFVSLDEGVIRVLERAFGVKVGKASWDSVRNVSFFLRRVNADDPAKYDYVLSRPLIMGYCKSDLKASKCVLCPLSTICSSAQLLSVEGLKRKPLRSRREAEIFDRFIACYSSMLNLNEYETEFPIGDYQVDAVLHGKDCTWYVVEVEEELTDVAIGQVVKYKTLFYRYKKQLPKPLIICRRADQELIKALELDPGISVYIV